MVPKFVLAALILTVVSAMPAPAAAAVPVPSDAVPAALPAPPERKNLAGEWRRFRVWAKCEAESLRDLLGGWLATLLAMLGGLLVIRKLRRKRHFPKRASWRLELAAALAEPMLILAGLCGGFLFLLPLLRAMPTHHPTAGRLFQLLATLCAAWGGMRLIGVLSRRMMLYAGQHDSNHLDLLLVTLARKVLQTALVIFTLFFIGQSIFGLNLTALLTGAGVAGLAVAFASRETLANFFGTVVIVADKPFRCGDRVRFNGLDGIVTEVGMRSTRIATPEETFCTVPNSQIETAMVENLSRRGVIRFAFTVPLVYETPPEQLRKALRILHEILDDFHGPDQERSRPRIFFGELAASSLNLKVIMWLKTANFREEEALRSEINLAIMERFRAAGLVFAYNTVSNLVAGDPAHPITVLCAERPRERS